MDHILTLTTKGPGPSLLATCSCGHWSAGQYGGYHHPGNLVAAHRFHADLTLAHHAAQQEPAMTIADPFTTTVRAGALGSAQIGHTIRLTTADGVTIEDTLTHVEHAVYGADKGASVRVRFERVQPAGLNTASAFLLGQHSAFKVNADTLAAITAGPTK